MNNYRQFGKWKNSRKGAQYVGKKDVEAVLQDAKDQSKNYKDSNPSMRSVSAPKPGKDKGNPSEGPSKTSRSKNPKSRRVGGSREKEKVYTLDFQLVSEDKVDVSCKGEHLPSAAIDIIRQHGGTFIRDTMSWELPMFKYTNLFTTFVKGDFSNIALQPIPELPINFLTQPVKLGKINFKIKNPLANNKNYQGPKIATNIELDYTNDVKHTPSELPIKLQQCLYNFQKTGINFGITRDCRLLLADEMGVGKTIQAIGLCSIFKEDWPVLILCPSSLRYNWRDEILQWLETLIKKEDIQVIKKSKEELKSNAKFYVFSYDLALRMQIAVEAKKFNFVVADEAHYLKNRDAKRTKFLTPIMQRAKRVILISGTPILAKPVEAFNLLSILRPHLFFNFMPYGKRYCNPTQTQYGIDWSGSANAKELHFILNKLMIRRLKKDVLTELPPKKRQRINIQTDKKIINQIRAIISKKSLPMDFENEEIMGKLNLLDNDGGEEDVGDSKDDSSLSWYTKAYLLTGQAKIEGIKEYITYLLDNNCKFLIFAHHTDVLDGIEEIVRKKKVDFMRIDGSTSLVARDKNVHKFQTDKNCLVAILSITACATGLTLTAASTVVFAELHFTPSIMIQAEDRAHRIGQEAECVNIHYLIAEDTLDEVIFTKLTTKMKVVTSTLDNKESDLGVQKTRDKVGEFVKGEDVEKNAGEGSNSKIDDYVSVKDKKGVKRKRKELKVETDDTAELDEYLSNFEDIFKL
ncbi:MAG: DEAD/DEAH box helicase [archaeon]|nr:DEAD/DEAH box helicase [archaeon]